MVYGTLYNCCIVPIVLGKHWEHRLEDGGDSMTYERVLKLLRHLESVHKLLHTLGEVFINYFQVGNLLGIS